jgi:hypothetical protein
VSPFDQIKPEPTADKVENPHSSTDDTEGAEGIISGSATTFAIALVHPFTVWVTVYVPVAVTEIETPVAPVDHDKFDPEAAKTELPQLFVTVTTGVEGIELTAIVIALDVAVGEPDAQLALEIKIHVTI